MKLRNNLKCLVLAGMFLSNFYSTAALAECSTAPLSHTENYKICTCKAADGQKIIMYTTEDTCRKCESPKPEYGYSDCKLVTTN
jgi:hypothetical protein